MTKSKGKGSMSSKRKRKPMRNLAHGAIEKELRALHIKGQHIERQRDLTRALLHAVLIKHGNEVIVTRAQLDLAGNGNSAVESLPDEAVRIIFTSDNPENLMEATSQIMKRPRSFWQRLWSRLTFWRKS